MRSTLAKGRAAPLLVVLSGPSGSGKDAVLARMRERGGPYHYAITATTRPQRANEADGKDYVFVSEGEFRRMVADAEMLEWAEVYGNLYGVPRSQVSDALARGLDVIVKTDVQGAATIKRLAPDALLVFITTPSIDDLAERLRNRMTEPPEALKARLDMAEKELADSEWFDHVVINENGKLDETARKIEEAISRERRGLSRHSRGSSIRHSRESGNPEVQETRALCKHQHNLAERRA